MPDALFAREPGTPQPEQPPQPSTILQVSPALDPDRLVACALTLVDDATDARTPAALVDRFLYGVSSDQDGGGEARPAADPFQLERIRAVCPADWSAAFVHFVGYWSQYDPERQRSAWPLPPARTAAALAAYAAERDALIEDAPARGDIYVLWSPAEERFVRTGIVCGEGRLAFLRTGAPYFDCLTIDADTTREGALHGPNTVLMRRRLSPAAGDRLVRWPLVAAPPAPVAPPPPTCTTQEAA